MRSLLCLVFLFRLFFYFPGVVGFSAIQNNDMDDEIEILSLKLFFYLTAIALCKASQRENCDCERRSRFLMSHFYAQDWSSKQRCVNKCYIEDQDTDKSVETHLLHKLDISHKMSRNLKREIHY